MVGDITIRRTATQIGLRWCWEVQRTDEWGMCNYVGGWTYSRRGALREARRNGGERLP